MVVLRALTVAASLHALLSVGGSPSGEAKHPDLVTDVRGKGLMIGVEFATDEVAELTVAVMLKRGMCAAFTLNNPRVIRLEPPLIISEDEVRTAVAILDEALTATRELLAL